MAGYNGPEFQRMISFDRAEFVEREMDERRRMFSATKEDVEVKNIEAIPEWEQKHMRPAFHSRYEVHWYTYKGWKVYMWCTGCLASDPSYEKEIANACRP